MWLIQENGENHFVFPRRGIGHRWLCPQLSLNQVEDYKIQKTFFIEHDSQSNSIHFVFLNNVCSSCQLLNSQFLTICHSTSWTTLGAQAFKCSALGCQTVFHDSIFPGDCGPVSPQGGVLFNLSHPHSEQEANTGEDPHGQLTGLSSPDQPELSSILWSSVPLAWTRLQCCMAVSLGHCCTGEFSQGRSKATDCVWVTQHSVSGQHFQSLSPVGNGIFA